LTGAGSSRKGRKEDEGFDEERKNEKEGGMRKKQETKE
jgi:hypothetical protein